MVEHAFATWLRRIMRPSRGNSPRPSWRPSLEPLEDRRVPAVYLVTTTANAGAGSLRQAILYTNANVGPNTIEFDIEPGGAQTINLTSPLPTVANPVTIDGTTQPGWISSPLITVDGSGITALSANGLTATANGCQFKGLIVEKFTSGAAGIALYSNNNLVADCWLLDNSDGFDIANAATGNTIGGTTLRSQNVISGNGVGISLSERSDANTIEGNLIGTDSTGMHANPNGDGIVIQTGCVNNIIGGSAPGQGNVISGNFSIGLVIDNGCDGNQIEGNLIGTNSTGTSALPNASGLFIESNGNTIGGAAVGAGNVISGNTSDGIQLDGNSNQVLGNRIGPGLQNVLASSNLDGIDLKGVNNTIGGSSAGAGNTIAFNTGNAIDILFGAGNAIRANSLFSNGHGIVLTPQNQTNNNQPAPVLTSAVFNTTTHVLTISGSLTAAANTKYTLDFFANAVGDAEGNVYLGSVTVTTGASGKASFATGVPIKTSAFTASVPLITATATDPNGNTSPFSNGVHDPVAKPTAVAKPAAPAKPAVVGRRS